MIPTTSECSQQQYDEVVTNEGNISMLMSGRESNASERKDDVTQIMPADCELEQCGGAGSGREFGGEGVQVGMTGLMEKDRWMGANIEKESVGHCVGEDEGLVVMSGLMVKGGGEDCGRMKQMEE